MNFVADTTAYLEVLALKVPVLLFAFIGGLIEEVVAPIPSPLVMVLAGSIISSQGTGLVYIVATALTSAIAKTLGCWLWYFLGDKGEDYVIPKFGKYIGVSSDDLESVGKAFKNTDKDFLVILLARSLPVAPTTPVSLIAGLLKMDLKRYLAASFIGNLIRNSLFLYMGYLGKESYQGVVTGLDSIESAVQIALVAILIAFVGFLYFKRAKNSDSIHNFIEKLTKK